MTRKTIARTISFQLALTAEKYLEVYKGNAQNVLVQCEDMRSIQFPASAIQKFLTHEGIFGRFEIQFDENHKLIQVVRID